MCRSGALGRGCAGQGICWAIISRVCAALRPHWSDHMHSNFPTGLCLFAGSNPPLTTFVKLGAGFYGLPRVFLRGQWQPIGGRNFNFAVASVICWQLGYREAILQTISCSDCGPYQDFSCAGTEPDLLACGQRGSTNTGPWWNMECKLPISELDQTLGCITDSGPLFSF